MSKKIVFLADCLVTQKAGIHFFAKQFIKRAISQYPDNQYFIVLPYPYGELNAKEILVPIKKWLPGHFRLRSFIDIPKAVKQLEPDLVIEMAHFGPFNLSSGIKKATVIHDLTPINFPEWHDKMSYLTHHIFLPKLLANSDYLVVNSDQTKDDLISFFPKAKSKILRSYPSLEDQQSKENQDLTGLLKDESYLLSVGTIEPRKNYLTLIKAFDKLASKFSKLHLRIVGYKGWKSKNVFELIERSSFMDRIILEGYTTDSRLRSLYTNATAFVFPSLYEGFGLPLLEALSFGLPILSSNIPTSKEVCADAALYFETTDDRALVEQALLLLQNEILRKEYAQKSKDRFIVFNQAQLQLDELFS